MLSFRETILVVDLSNVFYFCKPPWIEEKMIAGGYDMVNQFMVMLDIYMKVIQPSKIYFTIDGYPKWRYDIFPEYKGTRPREETPATEAFKRNRNAIKRLLKYFPVGNIYNENLEADDIAYIICKYYEDKDVDVVALSTDKDWLQLVNHFKNVKVYNQLKKVFIDKLDEDIVRTKCLTGDDSDNISGFYKIGPVTAKKILKDKETFFNWYNKLPEEGKQLYKRNLKLMSLKRIPEEYVTEVLKEIPDVDWRKKVDWDGVRDYYDSLNLNKENIEKYKDKIDDLCRT